MKTMQEQAQVLKNAADVWMKWVNAIFNDEEVAKTLVRHGITRTGLSLNARDFCGSPFKRGMMFATRQQAIACMVDFFGEIPYLHSLIDENVNFSYNEAVNRLWGAMCRILYHRDMCPGHKYAADKYFPLE